jgi:hypothetical protein
VRVGDEYVRVGDRGNTVDQVEEADRYQQRHGEDDHPIAFTLARAPVAPHCCRRHSSSQVRIAGIRDSSLSDRREMSSPLRG